MGSDSDLPVMQAAIDVLDEFGVPHEVRIVSAHRTPDVMYDYARDRGRPRASGDHRRRGRCRGAARDDRVDDAAPGDRRARAAGPARRPRLAAVDRADARRCPGRHGRGRATRRTRACSRCASSPRVTRSCARAMEQYQADLAEQIHAKDAAVQERFGGRRITVSARHSLEIERSMSSLAARRAGKDRGDRPERPRRTARSIDERADRRVEGRDALIVERRRPRTTRRTDRSRARAACRAGR